MNKYEMQKMLNQKIDEVSKEIAISKLLEPTIIQVEPNNWERVKKDLEERIANQKAQKCECGKTIRPAMEVRNMKEDIERAIGEIKGTNFGECQCHYETMVSAYEALQEKLERLENKPLTVKELAKEYINQPVWVSCEEEWKIIDCIYFDVFCPVDKPENHIEFTDGAELEYSESNFYKYKPGGEEK